MYITFEMESTDHRFRIKSSLELYIEIGDFL
jgi:hypothetical protein